MKINNKNHIFSERGITLVEILVVVFIIALFSSILIADFPKIRRQFALTRAVYKMNQDLRRALDMGLSGQQIKDVNGNAINVQGYGVYINLDDFRLGNKKYIIYADTNNDQQYDSSDTICGQQSNQDCIIEKIDFIKAESGVKIKEIKNTKDNNQWVDINFKPPNPTVTITKLSSLTPDTNQVQIIFALESDSLTYRTVFVNIAGLIEIE